MRTGSMSGGSGRGRFSPVRTWWVRVSALLLGDDVVVSAFVVGFGELSELLK